MPDTPTPARRPRRSLHAAEIAARTLAKVREKRTKLDAEEAAAKAALRAAIGDEPQTA